MGIEQIMFYILNSHVVVMPILVTQINHNALQMEGSIRSLDYSLGCKSKYLYYIINC